MPIRLSGLISGLDTDSIVKELVSAQSQKKEKYEKAQTKLEWSVDAWKSLNKKVYSFYTGSLSQMRLSSSYNKKSASIADSTIASVSASSKAVNGTQTLSVQSLSKTGYLTGSKLSEDKSVSGTSTLSSLGYSGTGKITVGVDGGTKEIEVNENTTVNSFIGKLKEAGLNANFDETNQRLFISSKTSGADHDFTMIGDANGIEALKDLGVYSVSDADKAEYEAVAALTADDFTNSALNDYLDYKISAANTLLSESNTTLTNENTELNKQLSYAALSDAEKTDARTTLTDTITAETDTYNATITELDTQLSEGTITQEEYDTQAAAARVTLDGYEETLAMYDQVDLAIDGTVAEPGMTQAETYAAQLSDQIAANTAEIAVNNTTISTNNTVAAGTYTTDEILALQDTEGSDWIEADYALNSEYQTYYAEYESYTQDAQDILADWDSQTSSSGSVRIYGADANITLNGAQFQSNTNNFSINGLTITAKTVSEINGDGTYQETDITTATDVDGIYDMVKDFLTKYNELIKEMDTSYNASSSSDYDPLTDDEKADMTDDEIEKWETKIKDSLLRKDSTLNGIVTAMKSSMSSGVQIDGKTYTMSTFGIGTLSYFTAGENEKGLYHIDGDADDDITSGNSDKLKEAIANDPDTVVSFLSQLSQGLYSSLTKKMASSSLSSAYTIYNDKAMTSQLSEYKTEISKWEDKIADYEDKYYKQFSAMESAMSTLQSNSSYLSQMLGS